MMRKVLFVNKCNPGSIIPEMLVNTGLEVRTVYDAVAALRETENTGYDMIIIMENWARETSAFCARLRRATSSPIIIISFGATPESCARALEAGADFFLRKPFGPMEFITRVNTLLQRLPDRQPESAIT